MADNINVKPSTDPTAVPVKTEVIGGEHVPVYKMATGEDGELFLVSHNAPLPVGNERLQESIEDLVTQIKILNAYMAEGFNEEITEEDIL